MNFRSDISRRKVKKKQKLRKITVPVLPWYNLENQRKTNGYRPWLTKKWNATYKGKVFSS